MAAKEVLLPDIGDFEEVDVAEVLVSAGDTVAAEDSLIVLESDKASMEIPSPFAGTITEMKVSVGDQVSQGALIALIEVEEEKEKEEAQPAEAKREEPEPEEDAKDEEASEPEEDAEDEEPEPEEDAEDEEPEASEPEKAERDEKPAPARRPAPESGQAPERRPLAPSVLDDEEGTEVVPVPADLLPERETLPHASPSVRRLARELGVDLRLVEGSSRKGRIVKEDVQGYVKSMIVKGTAAGVPIAGVSVAAPVHFDFSKFGETETVPLNRIRKLSAANLHRSWVTIPHVTQHDEADITELDVFRREMKAEAEERGVKLTFLPFVVKACAALLGEFEQFNASLDHTGENLILKRYINVGVAVDTPNGLVVPVVKEADRKGLYAIAGELMEISEKARSRKLRPGDLQGGSFSISSLGGIGGTFFTPIVNHPEVAVLGVGRMDWRPVFRDGEFVPRLVLPLSLSYDHRVIDGADAARFTTQLGELLGDLRRLIL